MVGCLSEIPPKGFAFGETAFQIFLLMAPRRLLSDRYFSSDYRPEIYTQIGIDWVEKSDMSSVLLRHYPQLASTLQGLDNAFVPWNKVKNSQEASL